MKMFLFIEITFGQSIQHAYQLNTVICENVDCCRPGYYDHAEKSSKFFSFRFSNRRIDFFPFFTQLKKLEHKNTFL